MKNRKIRNKDNVRSLRPDPRHWTRKQHSNSWKAKVALTELQKIRRKVFLT